MVSLALIVRTGVVERVYGGETKIEIRSGVPGPGIRGRVLQTRKEIAESVLAEIIRAIETSIVR